MVYDHNNSLQCPRALLVRSMERVSGYQNWVHKLMWCAGDMIGKIFETWRRMTRNYIGNVMLSDMEKNRKRDVKCRIMSQEVWRKVTRNETKDALSSDVEHHRSRDVSDAEWYRRRDLKRRGLEQDRWGHGREMIDIWLKVTWNDIGGLASSDVDWSSKREVKWRGMNKETRRQVAQNDTRVETSCGTESYYFCDIKWRGMIQEAWTQVVRNDAGGVTWSGTEWYRRSDVKCRG